MRGEVISKTETWKNECIKVMRYWMTINEGCFISNFKKYPRICEEISKSLPLDINFPPNVRSLFNK